MTTGYRASIGLGVALLSVALMTTEVVLTRIFSVVVWYHFAFFAISVALFGSGAASLVVHYNERRLVPARTAGILSGSAVALAVGIAVVDLAIINGIPAWFASATGSSIATAVPALVLLFVLSATPFFIGGFALSLAVTRYARDIHRLYFWDLAGAGAGCLAVIPLLGVLGGPIALLVSAAAAAGAALVFAEAESIDSWRRRLRRASAGVLVGLVALGLSNPVFGWLEIRAAKGLPLDRIAPEWSRWNSFSMVTVLPEVGFRGWGLSPAYRGAFPAQKTLVIDMNAMTTLTRFDGSLSKVSHALYDLSALVYRLKPGPERVCVIGAGGGKDVLAALAGGSRHVTAVEINPLIVNDVVRGDYRAFTGWLYDRQDVDVHIEDGRSFIARADRAFDVILLSMVDTSAATAAGAYALTENSLYTTDAFVTFLEHLAPGGIFSVSTTSLEGLAVGARLVALAREALRSLGRSPERSIAVVQTAWLGAPNAVLHDVLVKPDGFSPGELAGLERAASELMFVAAYVPGRAPLRLTAEQAWIADIVESPESAPLAEKMRALPMDITPVDDDRPFFFYQNRLRDLPQAVFGSFGSHLFGNGLAFIAKVAVIALVMVSLFLLLPLVVRRRDVLAEGGPVAADVAYVACLGLGFMFVEIALLQRFTLFLGQPTHTLAVVLFVLLTAGGVGSRLFARIDATRARKMLGFALLALVLYLALVVAAARSVLDAFVGWAPPGRALVAAALIAPAGLLLGMPFPTGLRAIAARAPARIPWLFGVNSATSVLGSVGATLVSLNAGISASLTVGLLLYVLALGLWIAVSAPRGPVLDSAAVRAGEA